MYAKTVLILMAVASVAAKSKTQTPLEDLISENLSVYQTENKWILLFNSYFGDSFIGMPRLPCLHGRMQAGPVEDWPLNSQERYELGSCLAYHLGREIPAELLVHLRSETTETVVEDVYNIPTIACVVLLPVILMAVFIGQLIMRLINRWNQEMKCLQEEREALAAMCNSVDDGAQNTIDSLQRELVTLKSEMENVISNENKALKEASCLQQIVEQNKIDSNFIIHERQKLVILQANLVKQQTEIASQYQESCKNLNNTSHENVHLSNAQSHLKNLKDQIIYQENCLHEIQEASKKAQLQNQEHENIKLQIDAECENLNKTKTDIVHEETKLKNIKVETEQAQVTLRNLYDEIKYKEGYLCQIQVATQKSEESQSKFAVEADALTRRKSQIVMEEAHIRETKETLEKYAIFVSAEKEKAQEAMASVTEMKRKLEKGTLDDIKNLTDKRSKIAAEVKLLEDRKINAIFVSAEKEKAQEAMASVIEMKRKLENGTLEDIKNLTDKKSKIATEVKQLQEQKIAIEKETSQQVNLLLEDIQQDKSKLAEEGLKLELMKSDLVLKNSEFEIEKAKFGNEKNDFEAHKRQIEIQFQEFRQMSIHFQEETNKLAQEKANLTAKMAELEHYKMAFESFVQERQGQLQETEQAQMQMKEQLEQYNTFLSNNTVLLQHQNMMQQQLPPQQQHVLIEEIDQVTPMEGVEEAEYWDMATSENIIDHNPNCQEDMEFEIINIEKTHVPVSRHLATKVAQSNNQSLGSGHHKNDQPIRGEQEKSDYKTPFHTDGFQIRNVGRDGTVYINVHKKLHHLLIGPKGNTIRGLRRDFGVDITVPPFNAKMNIVKVVGDDAHMVEKAVAQMRNIINNATRN